MPPYRSVSFGYFGSHGPDAWMLLAGVQESFCFSTIALALWAAAGTP